MSISLKLYKYCSANHLENLKNNVLFFNGADKVNDFYEILPRFEVADNIKEPFCKLMFGDGYDKATFSQYPFEVIIDRILDDILVNRNILGISCFSELYDSILMWSHYADKNKGICIEYDSNKPMFDLAKKVTYSENIYTINVKNELELTPEYIDSEIIKLCYHKYNGWNYEKEWRILFQSNGLVEYEPKSLTAIYFGSNMEIADIERVFEYTKHIDGLKYYRQLFHRRKYKLSFGEVTYSMLKKNNT